MTTTLSSLYNYQDLLRIYPCLAELPSGLWFDLAFDIILDNQVVIYILPLLSFSLFVREPENVPTRL